MNVSDKCPCSYLVSSEHQQNRPLFWSRLDSSKMSQFPSLNPSSLTRMSAGIRWTKIQQKRDTGKLSLLQTSSLPCDKITCPRIWSQFMTSLNKRGLLPTLPMTSTSLRTPVKVVVKTPYFHTFCVVTALPLLKLVPFVPTDIRFLFSYLFIF